MQYAQHQNKFDKILGVLKDIIGQHVNEKGNYVRWGSLRYSVVSLENK